MQCKTYYTGDAVFRVGDMADGIYFVETGTLAVLMQIEGVEKKVSERGPGQYFGELGLFTELALWLSLSQALTGSHRLSQALTGSLRLLLCDRDFDSEPGAYTKFGLPLTTDKLFLGSK